MSKDAIPSIQTLPVEILHRIFDYLDAETILLSLRPMCRLFRSSAQIYNRYVLDFTLMSKPNFVLLCRLINPENAISLTLLNYPLTSYQTLVPLSQKFESDNFVSNQITVFFSLVAIRKLTQLRCLNLLNISEIELRVILKHFNCNSLTSFSFNIREDINIINLTTTLDLVSKIITKPSLRNLKLSSYDGRVSKMAWPINCTIQYLTIDVRIDLNNLCRIFQSCPHLHTLFVRLNYFERWDNIIPTTFPQLTSLTIDGHEPTIDGYDATIDRLEHFFLFTPSLIYLKVIHGTKMLDGHRWEQFIQIHLPHLYKYEFFFEEKIDAQTTPSDIELINASFRTPFWVEHKKWFVNCEYNINEKCIILYTIPICKSELQYHSEYKRIVLPNSVMMIQDDATINNNIKSLTLLLNQSLAHDIKEKGTMTKSPLFPKVTEIVLTKGDEWSLYSAQVFSVFIDFSQIVQLTWAGYSYEGGKEQSLICLNAILEQTHNLLSLFIGNDENISSHAIDNLCLIIPRLVKHLKMPVRNVKQINIITERCENLSTVQFHCTNSKFSREVREWFANNTIYSTYGNIHGTANVWIGKKKIQTDENRRINKRWKKLVCMCSNS